MNKLTRRAIFIFAFYLSAALGFTFIILKMQARQNDSIDQPREDPSKQGDRLQPFEQFYSDRNYPQLSGSPGLYQERLARSMAYDQATVRINRGLDHPWTLQGPGNIGGRVNAIAAHPTNPDIILLGYSQGGVYRTTDGGAIWTPVFDDQASLSISHISYSPHDDQQLWAATGDANISGYPFIGAGIYKSDDGGITWRNSGLSQNGVLSKVVVDPNFPDIIYVGSMGYPSQKGNERGLFRSLDGGETWTKSLTIDDSTGVIDLVVDPLTPGRIFASGWMRMRSNKYSSSLGSGTSLYRSDDYGNTWVNIKNGLPDSIHSRTSIEITNNGTVFISYLGEIYTGGCQGSIESLQNIYKSIDGGMSWDTIPTAPENGVYCDLFGQFGWYFEVLKVNPENPQDMFLLGVDILRTVDGGENWFEAGPPWWTYEVHADKHDLVFAHDEILLATDGGAYKTDINQFNDWIDIENIPSTQFYRTTWNPHAPELYYGGAQDNGTSGGNEAMHDEWIRILGGDGFQPLFDPYEPTWMYALTQNGAVYFSDDSGFDFGGLNKGLRGSRYWDMPFVMNSHDSKVLYCGSNKMFRIDMRDSIRQWQEISDDLTRGDTILGNRYPAITAIAQSPLDESRLYAGTQDGLLWTTADGGENWTNITEGTPGFFVTSITCSTENQLGVFVTYSGYRDNDHQPYIYRSDDAGAVWFPIQSDLPMMGVNSFFILPGWNDAVLFAATDGGVYVSQDAGIQWDRVGSNMPYTPVYDLDYNPVDNLIIAATFSRGIMTFPVEELDLVSSTNGVKQEPLKVAIYPTIATDFIYLTSIGGEEIVGEYQVSIYDMQGHVVEIQTGIRSLPRRVDFSSSHTPGVYIANISNGERVISNRFLVQ